MTRTNDKSWLVPEYLSEADVAVTLGRSRAWLKQMRPALEREGFPTVDALIGLTCRQDVLAWVKRRRRVADVTEAEARDNTRPEPGQAAGIRYDRL